MKLSTWQAIAARHIWFKEVLRTRAEEWPDERIGASTNPDHLLGVIKLFERAERHELRIQRHLDRALSAMRTAGGRQ
jgi:hypothetical protein